MRFPYYPGCSLEGASGPYDRSLRRVLKALGHELDELDDWNCCGATMYFGIQETVALAVSARNLAIAESMGTTLVAPCSACYTTLRKTQKYLAEVPEMTDQVGAALAEAELNYHQTVKVRHPLDLIVNDIGIDTVARAAKRNLAGLRIAPYYGCQIVRPGPGFDDPDWPTTMDELFTALGAECVYFPDRVRCCGGMLISTFPELGKDLTGAILETALENEANVVATTCPLCQINLEANQKRNNGNGGRIPVLFFTQILGVALGLSFEEMDLHRSIIPLGEDLLALAGGAQ